MAAYLARGGAAAAGEQPWVLRVAPPAPGATSSSSSSAAAAAAIETPADALPQGPATRDVTLRMLAAREVTAFRAVAGVLGAFLDTPVTIEMVDGQRASGRLTQYDADTLSVTLADALLVRRDGSTAQLARLHVGGNRVRLLCLEDSTPVTSRVKAWVRGRRGRRAARGWGHGGGEPCGAHHFARAFLLRTLRYPLPIAAARQALQRHGRHPLRQGRAQRGRHGAAGGGLRAHVKRPRRRGRCGVAAA